MKRLVSMVLLACMLLSVMNFARAEDGLRVLDSWWAADEYRKAYPEREITTLESKWDENGKSLNFELLQSVEWDAACIETTDYSLAELNRLGLTLDLGSYPQTAAVAENLYPSIREGCSADGKLLALPAGYLGSQAYTYSLLGTDYRGNENAEGAAMRDQLGFTAEDQPKTFAEVCALGLRYMALDRETRKGTTFLFSDTAPQGFMLLYNMILVYQMEATDENGSINFDTPAFRAALENADPLLAAFAADPKRTYGKNGTLWTVLVDGAGVFQYGVFPHVTESTSIPALMTIVIVNPKSKHLDEAIDYAVIASQQGDSTLPLQLYQNADFDDLLRQSYDKSIATQIEEHEDQSVIDDLERRKAAGDETYFTSRGLVKRYAEEIAPKLVFPRWKSFPMDDAIFDYIQGKTDMDGFIAALNVSAAQ